MAYFTAQYSAYREDQHHTAHGEANPEENDRWGPNICAYLFNGKDRFKPVTQNCPRIFELLS